MFETISENVTNRRTSRTWFGGLGAVLLASGVGALGDGVGVLAGVGFVACWYLVPTRYVVAVGTLLVAVIVPAAALSAWGSAIALGLGMILVEPAFARDELRETVPPTVAGLALLGGTGWAVARTTDELWSVVSVVIVIGGLAIFVLHRYERARLQQMGVAT